MRDILPALHDLTARGQRCVVATVIGVRRSAPRPLGAKMVIGADGTLAGSVSGGCVEAAVVQAAEEVLAGRPPRLISFASPDRVDEIDGRLPCGGELDVWVQEHRASTLPRRVAAHDPVVEVTAVAGAYAGGKLVLGADGPVDGTLGDPALDRRAVAQARRALPTGVSVRDAELFYDVCPAPPALTIVGAVDLAAALSGLAAAAGWRTTIIDPRGRYAVPDRFPAAERVIAGWPCMVFAARGGLHPGDSVIALSHDAKIDDDAVIAALRSPTGFVGAMGSRGSHRERLRRLRAAGLGDELDRLAGPLGLDLGAVSVPETALSILAELVAVRHGRAGGRLRDGSGPVHGRAGGRLRVPAGA